MGRDEMRIERVPITQVQVGARLARGVTSPEGVPLLSPGMALEEAALKRLKEAGVRFVHTFAPVESQRAGERSRAVLRAEVERQLVEMAGTLPYPVSDALVSDAMEQVRQAMADAKLGRAMDGQWAREAVDALVGEILAHQQVPASLYRLKRTDLYTYAHSVSVAVLALTLAIRAGYDQGSIREIGLTALLHDLGKSRVPGEVLFKPGKLDPEEWEAMKAHSRHGYDILEESAAFPEAVTQGVLQHHERWDAGGYPLGREGERISPFARLVAVVDTYDAMTSDRVYRSGSEPYEAVEALIALSGSHFDPHFVRLFLEHVQIYPTGTLVELSTGEAGVVFACHSELPTRPVVRVLVGPDAAPLRSPHLVDLAKEPSILMTRVLGLKTLASGQE